MCGGLRDVEEGKWDRKDGEASSVWKCEAV